MQVTNLKFLGIPLLVFSTLSCNSSVKLWGKKTAHEIYAGKIENNPEGKEWINVSKNTLKVPYNIQLPYSHFGHFPGEQPKALTLEFTVRQGEKMIIDLKKNSEDGSVLYVDLFRKEGTDISHIESADTAQTQLNFDADETTTYLLRLQPELYQTHAYNLSISVAPSLDFPVAGSKAKAGSFWGDNRDAGKRKHEGVDIFAPKLTPAIAAADGYITGVDEGGIGGKTVWMKVADRKIHLYYAHLDKQLVEDGQRVKKGDTLGLVGNTGNAKYTPSHLHFGIYTHNGPIDPWPFVNKRIRSAPAVTAKDLDINLQWKKTTTNKTTSVNDELLVPLAVTSEGYIAELSDGKIISAPFASVKQVKPHKSQKEIVTVDPKTNSNN